MAGAGSHESGFRTCYSPASLHERSQKSTQGGKNSGKQHRQHHGSTWGGPKSAGNESRAGRWQAKSGDGEELKKKKCGKMGTEGGAEGRGIWGPDQGGGADDPHGRGNAGHGTVERRQPHEKLKEIKEKKKGRLKKEQTIRQKRGYLREPRKKRKLGLDARSTRLREGKKKKKGSPRIMTVTSAGEEKTKQATCGKRRAKGHQPGRS